MPSTIPEGTHAADGVRLTGSTFRDVCLARATFDDVDLADATFRDVNLTGARLDDVNLSGVAITNANVEGMTIDGVLVSEMLNAFHAGWIGAFDARAVGRVSDPPTPGASIAASDDVAAQAFLPVSGRTRHEGFGIGRRTRPHEPDERVPAVLHDAMQEPAGSGRSSTPGSRAAVRSARITADGRAAFAGGPRGRRRDASSTPGATIRVLAVRADDRTSGT